MKNLKKALSLLLALLLLPCVSAHAAENTFSDIPVRAPYKEAVDWCVEHELMNGVGSGRFDPTGVLTRATLATVLYRAEGEPTVSGAPSFTDVKRGQWYTSAAGWAAKEGLLQGYGNNVFGIDDPVTKVQLDIILKRYQGESPAWPGDPTKQNATRAEVATALYEALRETLEGDASENELSGKTLTVQFGHRGKSFELKLYDNATADKIAQYVGSADWNLPIYHYDDFDNWEVMQYYDIPRRYDIPDNSVSVTSEKAGAVYYSHPNRIILFYGDAEVSNKYTPVGYIEYSQEFVDAVENNPVLEGWGNKIVIIKP